MKVLEKLKKESGFALSEFLVAILIFSLMGVALTAGMSASLRVYRDEVRYAEERTLLSTLSEAVMSELRNAKEIVVDSEEGSFTFTSMNFGPNVSFTVEDGKLKIGGKSLIGDGSYINGTLKVKYNDDGAGNDSSDGSNDESLTTKIEPADGIFRVTIVLESGESRSFEVKPLDPGSM